MLAANIALFMLVPVIIVVKLLARVVGNPLFVGQTVYGVAHYLYGITVGGCKYENIVEYKSHLIEIRCPSSRSTRAQVEVDGRRDMLADDHPTCVYIMNHQGFLDAAVLAAILPPRLAIIGPSTLHLRVVWLR